MGGAGRATHLGSEGPMLNPANFPQVHSYHLGGIFTEKELESEGFETEIGGYIIDRNPDAIFPAMLTYSQKTRRLRGDKIEESNWGVEVGKMLNSWWAMGVEVRYFTEDADGEESHFNGGIGSVFVPFKNFATGVVFRNIHEDHTLGMRPTVEVGAGYHFESVMRVALDAVFHQKSNPDSKGIYSLGVESYLPFHIQARLGGRQDDLNDTFYYSGGLGWYGPKVSINYAYEKNGKTAGQELHSFDLAVYF